MVRKQTAQATFATLSLFSAVGAVLTNLWPFIAITGGLIAIVLLVDFGALVYDWHIRRMLSRGIRKPSAPRTP